MLLHQTQPQWVYEMNPWIPKHINWYHSTFSALALPSPMPFAWFWMGSSAQRSPLASWTLLRWTCPDLSQNCQGFRHCPDEHMRRTDSENHCETGNALTHNILEATSAGHKTECLKSWNIQILNIQNIQFRKLEYSDPSSRHLDTLAWDWLVHTAWSRKEGKKKPTTSNLFF